MDIISGIILGAVQGLTEFLPISSSGHLILVRSFLSLPSADGLAFDAVLQLATTFAVAIYFWRDLLELAHALYRWIRRQPINPTARAMLSAIAIGTVPAIILGLTLEELMDSVFRSTMIVVGTLLIGAALMYAAELYANRRPKSELTWRRGLIIGLFQCLALVPGMSRSGSTISGGLFVGLSRAQAARFSFLLSLPILAGTGLKKLMDLGTSGSLNELGLGLLAGFIAAFVVGLAAIHFLIGFLQRHSLRAFVAYRVLLAAVVFWLLYLQII
ncbi:MAG: undecaprenyl-diphosphatase UppP [Patescibacteria group bacterium]